MATEDSGSDRMRKGEVVNEITGKGEGMVNRITRKRTTIRKRKMRSREAVARHGGQPTRIIWQGKGDRGGRVGARSEG